MSDTPSSSHAHPRVTMSTIAQQIGVTKTTVSLALRDHPSISKATTEKVKTLAKKLGYRPDPAISAIATQRWSIGSPSSGRVIAYLRHEHEHAKSTQGVYLEAASRRAYELGYKLEPFNVDEYPNATSISRVLYSRGIRGIIVPPIANPNSKRVLYIEWDKFTAVCCGIGRVKPQLHTVTPDTFAHTHLVWKVLQEAGYKRIGAALMKHNPLAYDDLLRVGASTAAIHLLELEEAAKIPIFTGEFEDKKSLINWYEKHRPEVLLGFNQSVWETLDEAGFDLASETEFVSLLTPEGCEWSGIVHHYEEIAVKAVELLDSELRHNQWGLPKNPNTMLVVPKWNDGNTLRVKPELHEGRIVSIKPHEIEAPALKPLEEPEALTTINYSR
ncbi:LacI family DNA-binding transcriptional regulator [Pelagicoccus sp. SDUM812002]|uniref:LacI family DNA-binding transcriptional regulator n=1 Tax=Pelagicoccus sp. SDUM812002 TaxID=3041266 RepID=UPI00280C9884|nr:LacI family DNA-binding transcriptional regulator [Pelagicoccus sp. SDUM812002]MDQ8186548.1 LacI family DNA-binding transcriptional regulator [Pelagicoccus sp. SDUM812002]